MTMLLVEGTIEILCQKVCAGSTPVPGTVSGSFNDDPLFCFQTSVKSMIS